MPKCVKLSDASLSEWVNSKTISLNEFTDFYRPQPLDFDAPQPANGSMPPPLPLSQTTNDRMRPGFFRPQPPPTNDTDRDAAGDVTWKSLSRRTSEQSQLSWEELSGQDSQSGFKAQQSR